MIDRRNISVLVLTGGQAKRMNGASKSLVLIKNKTLFQY